MTDARNLKDELAEMHEQRRRMAARFEKCEGDLARERIAHRETRREVERLRDLLREAASLVPAIRSNLDGIVDAASRAEEAGR